MCPQREIIHDIWVEKPSLYRLVMRYVNPRPEPILASVQMTPESPLDIPQNVQVGADAWGGSAGTLTLLSLRFVFVGGLANSPKSYMLVQVLAGVANSANGAECLCGPAKLMLRHSPRVCLADDL